MYKLYIKPFLDLFVALLILPIVILCLIIVSPLIYIYDRGPIFYNAKRIGKNGKPFKMFKFRTMIVDAPDIRLPDGSTYNAEDDPRVTKIGKFLRKTSIDELPQIFNVLQGEMSFIGPRPDPVDWLNKYTEEEKVFLTVKPGITGYNQAYFRNSVDANTKIKNDIFYAENISFILDLKILLKTLQTVFSRQNIYINYIK